MSSPRVVSVSASSGHTFSKAVQPALRLIAGEGVEGDAHRGVTVKHRSRVAADPTQPNLRQVHLIGNELLAELQQRGFHIAPGGLGENIITEHLDLLSLPRETELLLGSEAVVRLTGLRNPCKQLDAYRDGLMAALLETDAAGRLVRKAGVMAIVVTGGTVSPGDAIQVRLPHGPTAVLERV